MLSSLTDFFLPETSTPAESGPRKSYIRGPVDAPPMKIELKRASSLAVPETHRSFPEAIEVAIDPLALRHSPQTRPHGSPGPSRHSPDSISPEARNSNFSFTEPRAMVPLFLEGDSRLTTDSGSAWSSETSSTTAKQRLPKPSTIWPFEEAITSRRSVHVPNLPDYIVEGLEVRGWGEPAREAVIIPVVVDDQDLPCAVVVLGLNSSRGYDSEYPNWVDLLRLSLNALMTAAKGREADLIRAE